MVVMIPKKKAKRSDLKTFSVNGKKVKTRVSEVGEFWIVTIR